MKKNRITGGLRLRCESLLSLLFKKKAPQDRAALIDMLREAENHNLLDHEALAMMEGAFQVSDMHVRDIMVPRVQMIVVTNNLEPVKLLTIVVEHGHSRFPVIGNGMDDILGILMAKDLLYYFAGQDKEKFNIKDIMRPAVFVPESKRLNVLLREFRSSRNHMAIVVDEYSRVSGLVTIEDIIEEIVGDIEDEHDIDKEAHIKPYGRNRHTVNALTPIHEFNEYFKLSLSDDEYDTIGGLVLNAFGHVPKRGELLEFEGFIVKILRADKRRIHMMRMTRVEPQPLANP
jgi:magnesium and cobalt transporter